MLVYLLYFLIGLVGGILSGLLGLGGGIVIVPALVAMGLSVHDATSTSLAAVMLTTAMVVGTQQRRHAIAWKTLQTLLPSMVIGAIAGVILARQLSADRLGDIFAIFCIVLAIKILLTKTAEQRLMIRSRVLIAMISLSAGVLSGLLGIGGGIVIIPVLMAMGLPMSVIGGTSAACIFPTALFGTLSTLWFDYGQGFLWAAVGLIGLGSVVAVPAGVYLNHRLPEKIVQRIFAGMLLVIAWQMMRQ